MKILQNPIAVVLLAVAAVGLIGKQIAWPILQRSHWMQHSPAAVARTAVAPAATPKSAAPSEAGQTNTKAVEVVAAAPLMKIDLGAAEMSAAHNAESPRRDPFEGQLLATSQAKTYPPARQLLHFNGYWRQTGGALAVINNRVLAAGELILAYKVESIDHDRIWVVGPNGREAVEFGNKPNTRAPVPPTNAATSAQRDR